MVIDELTRNTVKKDAGGGPKRAASYKNELPLVIGDFSVKYKKPNGKNGSIHIGVFDGNKGVAEMWLDPHQFHGLRVYQVAWAGLDPAYSGQGIGYQLYLGLISILGINIAQTTSHSIGARKTWLRLAKDPKIVAYGFDQDRGIIFHVEPNKAKTELKSAKKGIMLYDNSDTGMVLVKRNSKDDKYLAGLVAATLHKRGYSEPDIFGVKKFKDI